MLPLSHLSPPDLPPFPAGGEVSCRLHPPLIPPYPAGCTGARLTATLLHEMKRRGRAARFGVVSMCIGSGMGAAAVFERGGEVDDLPVRAVPGPQTQLSKDAVLG